MQDEATPPEEPGSDAAARARKGPRHAAPRKSLLARIQLPAGKAMALAAMPTAVFVGLSLTPRLALAEDKEIPYAAGPCAESSEEPSAPASSSPSQSPGPSGGASPGPTATPGRTDGSDGSDESAESAESTGSAEPLSGESPSAGRTEGATTAESPDPAATSGGSGHPLDPLGLGDAIEDLLGHPGRTPEPTPTPTASGDGAASGPPDPADPVDPADPSEPADPADPSEPSDPAGTAPGASPSADTSEPAETAEPAADEAERIRKAIADAAEQAGASVEELDEDAKGLDPRKDADIPDGAKPHFPCPTEDPAAFAAAELEPGLPLLADDPWILESSLLTLNGLKYHGIVEVRTGSGKVKKALKFTARSIDIGDLHQLAKGPEGTTLHVEARKGSTSTIREGTVTMYTEELKGDLFGLIPVTFSPRTPPPVNVPFAFFTGVTVVQAGQFGGTLTVPGLHNRISGGISGN
ncbi:hypothetical protein [Streptomyces katsurahamanus]|uniref:Hydrogenase expression protein HypF n=1 Tax=Streptomyces katsurahamanus TaxID=2577098 RepID=A0ABW9NNX8_9ACTN|nr:hypothetical protein [Streptomyces katsurahamanus]MQS34614.1 hypothetical protein [Streptomyces katsurahamanus]